MRSRRLIVFGVIAIVALFTSWLLFMLPTLGSLGSTAAELLQYSGYYDEPDTVGIKAGGLSAAREDERRGRASVVGRLMDVLDTQPSQAMAQYLKLHATERARLTTQRRMHALIYVCDDRYDCLGTGNRLQGVVDAFVLALVSSRAFFIVWNRHGEEITNFVVPSKHLDWRLPHRRFRTDASLHISVPKDHEDFLFRSDVVANLSRYDVVEVRSSVMWAAELLENPHVQRHAQQAGLGELVTHSQRGTLLQVLLTLLLRPSPLLIEALDSFDRRMRGVTGTTDLSNVAIIGLQIRTGGDGSWHDATRLALSSVKVLSASAILFARNASRDGLLPVVFIASDSHAAMNISSADLSDNSVLWTTMEDLVGPIGHVETSKLDAPGMFALNVRVWADFFGMALVDNAVHGRSSFSEMALCMACRRSFYYRYLHQVSVFVVPPFVFDNGFCDYWAHFQGHVRRNYLKSIFEEKAQKQVPLQ